MGQPYAAAANCIQWAAFSSSASRSSAWEAEQGKHTAEDSRELTGWLPVGRLNARFNDQLTD